MGKNLRQIPITCSGHTRPVVDLRFSEITPYSYYIISACKDGLPMLREGDTGDWIGTFEGHKGAVWGATINKEATLAATGAADFTAKLWDAKTGTELNSFSHRHIVKSVDFSLDSQYLVTGCNDKNLRLFDLNNYTSEPKVLSGHTSNIKKSILANGSRKVISISDDKTLRVWDTTNNTEISQLKFNDIPTSIEQSRDGQLLILSHGNCVELYKLENMEKIKSFSIPSHVSAVSINPDKSLFVCGSENFTLYKYSIESGVELESFKGHFGPVHCIQFSPDGEVYASGSEDGTLRLWQNTVGKTYGLWKLIDSEESISNTSNIIS
ncbi:unnamed protein product [Brachionus calyciflorus]|uniref:Serine-threonine kinase receptor-associated protein n=1 Tax=Brachionus calyciflorus TaxID=104777 RepID=A0A813NYS1_9BILA|nr:unnamed protein product [Brachionus calyciflorus]